MNGHFIFLKNGRRERRRTVSSCLRVGPRAQLAVFYKIFKTTSPLGLPTQLVVNRTTMDYITCPQTKSQYKVNVAVCQHCKHLKTCADYRTYIQPPLFPGTSRSRTTNRTIMRKNLGRTRPEVLEMPHKTEQLTLDL